MGAHLVLVEQLGRGVVPLPTFRRCILPPHHRLPATSHLTVTTEAQDEVIVHALKYSVAFTIIANNKENYTLVSTKIVYHVQIKTNLY